MSLSFDKDVEGPSITAMCMRRTVLRFLSRKPGSIEKFNGTDCMSA